MSRRRVSFSWDPEANQVPNDGFSSSRHSRLVAGGVFRSSPTARRLLRHIGAGVTKTLRFMSLGSRKSKKTMPSTCSSSLSCSSSSSSIHLAKSKSVNESESHRAEAIEDCIEFLRSSSSLSRSNSISACSSC